MALSTAKAVEVVFGDVMEAMELELQMADMADHFPVVGAQAQNANNVYWRQVEQQAPVINGWEFVDSDFGDVIEQSYPSTLGTPQNDLFKLRADDFRNRDFMQRRAKAAAKKLSAAQNTKIATAVNSFSTQFYRTATSGYDFVKTADTILNEQQLYTGMGQSFFVNNRDAQKISADLAIRQTVSGPVESAYKRGEVVKNTAGFDVYESSYLPTYAGSALAGVTVTTTVSQAPATSQTLGGVVLPADYRLSDAITLTGTLTNLVVGDIITFTGVKAVGRLDKTVNSNDKTFRVVAKSGQTIQVYPRPVAADDPALTAVQKAYANINTRITSGTAVVKMNSDTLARTNMFWCNDAIEIVDGDVPLEYFSQLDGMTVMTDSLKSGTRLYLGYQGKIEDWTLRVRLFTWNDVVVRDPERCGVAIYA